MENHKLPDDVVERYKYINDYLRVNPTAEIIFTKKDGTVRNLFGTLNSNFLPERELNELHKTKKVDWETFTVWDIEAGGWRAFKTMNLISIGQ